jgi:Pyruvate/2-oxoacid:ferredoxin oxidoreductase delta subunit
MVYRHAVFYFLTGTGNSYRAATWMDEVAQNQGLKTTLAPIQSDQPRFEIEHGKQTLLGLFYPTHGFTAPWLMIRFALRLECGRGTHAFLSPTRAGTKFGKVYFPGLEGTAGYLIALILLFKGYTVRGIQAMDMPSNWTTLHPGYSSSNAQAIIERTRPGADAFFQAILNGERRMRGIIPLLFGLALLPLSCGYLLMGRFFFSRMYFASERCNGCGLCVQICPAQAIRMWSPHRFLGKKAGRQVPYWSFACENCMRCHNYCPQQAIEASYPLAVLIYYLTTIPTGVMVMNWVLGQAPILNTFNRYVPELILQYIFILLSMALTYLFFSFLVRLPFFGHLFALVTPTRYYRRYHAPGTYLKDIRIKKDEAD